jgi:hemerythrin-like domain-containing protein
MDATRFLKQQHREVRKLFKKLSGARGPAERRALLDQVADKLTTHTSLEEKIFYPAVRTVETKKAGEVVNEAYEEHHVVDLVLAELPKVDPKDERFEAKMTVLEELVEHHVKEEETEMFKLAKKLGSAELRELGDRMEESVGGNGSGRG